LASFAAHADFSVPGDVAAVTNGVQVGSRG
jgi:hypothetical protein